MMQQILYSDNNDNDDDTFHIMDYGTFIIKECVHLVTLEQAK